MDTDFRQVSSNPDPIFSKMGKSNRCVEQCGFEGGELTLNLNIKIGFRLILV